MKYAFKAFAIAHMLTFTGMAFSQAVNPPANSATGARPGQGVVPGSPPPTQDPHTQVPNSNNPLMNPYPYPNHRQTARDMVPPAGPAVDDRDKVSCPANQEAVFQGSRLICVTRSNPPTVDQVNPGQRPPDPRQQPNTQNY